MRKQIKVCTVEYETTDTVNWKAVILAYNLDDAIKYIISRVPAYRKLLSTSVDKVVDGIDDNVYNDYFAGSKTVIAYETEPEEKKVAEEKEKPVCPECGKICGNEQGLKTHLRTHRTRK